MDNFLEKWHSDKKYQAKIKLILYLIFVLIVSIYAISINRSHQTVLPNENTKEETTNNKLIDIPNKYSYIIKININDKEYEFTGNKRDDTENITKTTDEIIENYILKDNEYYKEDNGNYFKTTKSSVYEPINYDYISLDNINLYLEKAEKNYEEYLVYVKDIILGNSSDEYFVININNNHINIDYTPLIKQIDSEIYKYTVNIDIEKE